MTTTTWIGVTARTAKHFARWPITGSIATTGASTKPLLLSHGWPWTFWDFEHLIGPLTDPSAYGGSADDAFDLVIPSLPGFIFSSPLRETGVGSWRTVGLWAKLMSRLGYQRYGVHGGDFGAGISSGLGHAFPDRIIGVHLTFPALLDGGLRGAPDGLRTEDFGIGEEDWPAHNAEMTQKTLSHITAHVHDGQTLAYAFNDSPVGLATWMLVRRRNASDCNGDLLSCYTADQLLTGVSLYWFTETIGSSMRWYAETLRHGFVPVHDRKPIIQAPTAVMVFPQEVRKFPRAFAERQANLRRWTLLDKGGHFAPAEQPQAVIDDLRAFFGELRPA